MDANDQDRMERAAIAIEGLNAENNALAADLFAARQALLTEGVARDKAEAEVRRLRDAIDCACNALTDSIRVSGNDPETNMHWVRKLRVIPDGSARIPEGK